MTAHLRVHTRTTSAALCYCVTSRPAFLVNWGYADGISLYTLLQQQQVSAYEVERLQNIARNKAVLVELGLTTATTGSSTGRCCGGAPHGRCKRHGRRMRHRQRLPQLLQRRHGRQGQAQVDIPSASPGGIWAWPGRGSSRAGAGQKAHVHQQYTKHTLQTKVMRPF